MKASEVLDNLKRRFPNEPEYHQAVSEVLGTIEEAYNEHPEFEKSNLIERLCIPDRIFSFRVTWMDDKGQIQTNMGYRIQHNNAIGPYKGGIRFHASVNQSILKFLAFEQTFKNSPMGGGKGGSDFSPRGKSNAEIMRFCQAFILELWHHIGPDTDVPAGDIGVGGREVAYMYGMYKKLARENTGTFTGKGIEFGGSLIRPEATGYGNVYFLLQMLKTRNIDIKDKVVCVSGSGNVAQYTVEKLISLGAKVVTMSDSDGYIYDPDGIDREKLDYIMELKNLYRGRIREYAEQYGCKYVQGARPWGEKCDIAMPSATQNELNGDDAKTLLANGCFAVSEGANMPSTPEAIDAFLEAKILYAPGKAANAGGVSVSGLEMTQNAQKLSWSSEEVDQKLQSIMEKTGLKEEDMIMNPTISTSATPLADKLTLGSKLNPVEGKSRLQHCCSGKHLSLMMLQRELTGKVTGYQLPDSPVQKQIISFLSMLSQTPTYRISLGIDGCGVPVFALPMRNIALAYAKLADPFNLPDDIREAITYNFDCINKNPEKINDYFTPSYYVNKNPDLLMKDGSRGVICMAIRSRKLGIVIKLEDGWSDEYQGIIVARVLEQLQYDDKELIEQLKETYNTKIYNDCKDEVGHAEADFDIHIEQSYFDELFGNAEPEEDDLDESDAGTANERADSEDSDIDSSIEDEDTEELEDDEDMEDEEQLSAEERARRRAIRDRRSILGQNVVLPSSSQTFIQNPMTDPMRPVKSAKVISTIQNNDAEFEVFDKKDNEDNKKQE